MPLSFDNVGRKLQQSINGLLKSAPRVSMGWSESSARQSAASLYNISKSPSALRLNSRQGTYADGQIQDLKSIELGQRSVRDSAALDKVRGLN